MALQRYADLALYTSNMAACTVVHGMTSASSHVYWDYVLMQMSPFFKNKL